MIIDCHGHYTTAPSELQDFRDAQIAHFEDASNPAPVLKSISDDQIREIIETQGRMEQLYDEHDMVDVFELDMEFHKTIVRAANNRVLAETHGAILARLWRARYLSASRKRSRDRVLQQHNAIATGLADRDVEMVKRHLHSHLEHLVINVRDYFEHGQENLPPEPDNKPAA